jgi:hypothetical protein
VVLLARFVFEIRSSPPPDTCNELNCIHVCNWSPWFSGTMTRRRGWFASRWRWRRSSASLTLPPRGSRFSQVVPPPNSCNLVATQAIDPAKLMHALTHTKTHTHAHRLVNLNPGRQELLMWRSEKPSLSDTPSRLDSRTTAHLF